MGIELLPALLFHGAQVEARNQESRDRARDDEHWREVGHDPEEQRPRRRGQKREHPEPLRRNAKVERLHLFLGLDNEATTVDVGGLQRYLTDKRQGDENSGV